MRLAFVLCLVSSLAHADFVRVDGNRFVVGTSPFVFAGANIDPLHGERERAGLEPTLDAVRADGLTVVRAWALGEGPVDAPDRDRDHVLFRVGEDGFLEPAYVALDKLLVAAQARGLRVMLTLCNAWPDFGGVHQYLGWAGLPQAGYGARDRFYADAHVRQALLAHIDRLLARVNSISGVRYVDDPTIFAWELMNESQVDGSDGVAARRTFVNELAAHIHSLDPSHLVASGMTGYGTRSERDDWRALCSLPTIDFCDSHLYPQTSDRVDDARALMDRVDDRVQLAHFVVGKPIVFGELGFDTRVEHDGWLGAKRAVWFDRLLGRMATDRVDGALVWIYQPWSGKPRDFGIYVDRPETDDVRASLRRFAAGIAHRSTVNPRLGPAAGDTQLYPVYTTLRGHGPRNTLVDDTVGISPESFTRARWERVGTWDGGPLVHAYGDGDGFYEWSFVAPRIAKRLVVSARISSELPGTDAPPDAWSIVTVSIDGHEVGAIVAAPDDGIGRIESFTVDDRAFLAALKPGPHTLRFAVPPGPHARGLCVYGRRTERAPDGLEGVDVTLRFAR